MIRPEIIAQAHIEHAKQANTQALPWASCHAKEPQAEPSGSEAAGSFLPLSPS
jgi:hypothetical protein